MKEVIFSKFSNERHRSYAIRTDILRDDSGKKTVKKTASFSEGAAYVRQIKEWEMRLSELFAGTDIRVNRVISVGEDCVELEYLETEGTLEEQVSLLWRAGRREEALCKMRAFLDLLGKLPAVPFAATEEFAQVFGCPELPDGLFSFPVTDLDLVTENILLTKDSRVCHLIDYEWTFAFPVPVHFVVYRIWHYLLSRNLPQENERELLLAEGLTDGEIRSYEAMERAFQDYICKDYIPVREMYARICPGCIALTKGSSAAENFVSRLYYGPDEAFCDQRTVKSVMHVDADGNFEVEFDLQETGAFQKLRWDPLDGSMCRIRVDEICADVPVACTAQNAVREEGMDVFWTTDPIYHLDGDFATLDRLSLRGHLQIIPMEEAMGQISRIWAKSMETQKKLEGAQAQLTALQKTAGFRALEKMRRARNRVRNRAKWLLAVSGLGRANDYQHWFEKHAPGEETLRAQRGRKFAYRPKISILVPLYQTPENYLREMIASVQAQTYGNWELCLADAGLSNGARAAIEELQKADERITYTRLSENLGISQNTNAAAALASGDYIAFLDHDDLLSPDALFEVAKALQKNRPQMLYTDEDKISMDGKEHFEPHLKPDFSPDLLRSHNYITHLLVVQKTLFDEAGGLRKEFDGAQDYDLILRCAERADRVCHIPKVLYHWRMHKGSTARNPESKMYAYQAGQRAIEEHLKRVGLDGTVEIMPLWGMYHVTYATPGDPLVSVIIPNKDHAGDLKKCVRSLLEKGAYKNIEVIVVENNSEDAATFAYYKELQKEFSQVRVAVWEGAFNYSALNNFGAKNARGDYLLFLNNDTELIAPESIRVMLGHCMRKNVGCVGAKLLYANDTVQHAGIVLGFGGFGGHVFHGIKKDDAGYMQRAQVAGNFSAVTAACMMVRREVYERLGGFDESFPVALNDMDFCMKVREAGYLIVMDPLSLWHHYESKSRGYENTPAKKERLAGEVARFRARWGGVVDAGDPYYNPNFALDTRPFTYRQ